nr:hypothetical protein [Actinomycetota bacterium]
LAAGRGQLAIEGASGLGAPLATRFHTMASLWWTCQLSLCPSPTPVMRQGRIDDDADATLVGIAVLTATELHTNVRSTKRSSRCAR